MFGFLTLGLIVIGIVAATGVSGHGDVLTETLPPPGCRSARSWPAGWCSVRASSARSTPARVRVWLVPGVLGTFLLQQGATHLAGAVIGTLMAGTALGACANLVSAHPERPPRLILLLGGFFVLTVGGVGVRGATALLGGDVISGLQNLADFALQVPTVALALAAGVILSDHWRHPHRSQCSRVFPSAMRIPSRLAPNTSPQAAAVLRPACRAPT